MFQAHFSTTALAAVCVNGRQLLFATWHRTLGLLVYPGIVGGVTPLQHTMHP